MRSRSREINVFSMSALDLFASALGAFILISIVLMPYFLRMSNEEVQRLQQELDQARSALQQCEARAQRESACREQLAGLQAEVERLRAELEQSQVELEQTQAELEQAQAELEQAQAELEQAQAERDQAQQSQPALERCREELEACEERLLRTFLIVVIHWETGDDQYYRNHDVDLHVIDPDGGEYYYGRSTIPGRDGELRWDTRHSPGVEIWELPVAPPGQYQILYNFYSQARSTTGERIPNPIVQGGVSHRDDHHRFRKRTLNPDRIGRPNAMLVAVVTVNDDGSVDVDER